MQVFVDIDNTIAGRNIVHFSRYCNVHWQLGIAEERLQKGNISYQAFFSSPELCAFQKKLTQDQWQATLQQAEQAPEVLARQCVLPGAVEGVNILAAHGRLTYCTVRANHEAVRQATIAWLSRHQFPSPNRVLFCRSLLSKLVHLYRTSSDTKELVILIDDLYVPLLQELGRLDAGCHPQYTPDQCRRLVQVLREKLTLIAFQADTIAAQCHGLRVLPLPSWQHLDEVLPSLCPRRASPSSAACFPERTDDACSAHSPRTANGH